MAKRITYSRADLQMFWKRTQRPKAFLFRPVKVALNFFKDVQLFLMFMLDMAKA